MRSKVVIGVAAAGLALVAACGTRLPDEEFATTGGAVAVDGSGAPVAGGQQAGPGTTVAGRPGAATATTRPGGAAAPGVTVAGGGPAPTAAGGAPVDPAAPVEGGEGAATPAAAGPNEASDVGITETTIRIGTIVAENGVLGDAFAPAARGLRAWVEDTNANGGIGGRTVELFTCDDREDRARHLECAQRLVEDDQVFAIIAMNSRASNGAANYLNEVDIPVLGFPISNSWWRFSNFYAIYAQGYPRDDETVANNGEIISQAGFYRWFRENLGVSRAAVFSYDIAESAQAGDFLEEGFRLEGYEVTRYTVSFAAPSFDQAVADMERQGIDIISDAMDDGANRRLCDAMGRRGFSVLAKVSTIVGFAESVGTDFDDACRNSIFITGDSRPYTDTSVPIIAQFNEAMARYQPGVELHQWSLEAWAQALMLRDYLVAAGPAPTRAGFHEFLGNLDDFSAEGIMKGFDVDYQARDYDSPTRKHCFSIARWQDSAPGGWILATDPFPFCYDDAGQYGTPVRDRGD